MTKTAGGDAACIICGTGTIEELIEYRSLRRVTSDCRPWPAGGRIGVCRTCGAVQKPADDAFLADIDDIYRSYTIYHQAYLRAGGRFIVPVPDVRVVASD